MQDNFIQPHERDSLEEEILRDYAKSEDFHSLKTYDMVQSGYPYPNHGEMIERDGYGGTNEKNELLPPRGMWCKVEDILPILKQLEKLRQGIFVCPNCQAEDISDRGLNIECSECGWKI